MSKNTSAKEYLSGALRMRETIESLREELAMIRTESGGGSVSGGGKRYNGDTAEIGRVIRAISFEERIEAEIAEKNRLLEEIHDVIGALSDSDEKIILRLRYINGRTWGYIAKRLHMSNSTARRIHEEGVSHIKLPKS